MNSNTKITVVIVTYHSRNTIDQALRSLQPAVADGLARCVVVDNASADGTADYVEREYAGVEVIRSAENLGFGRGCNLGAQGAQTPYLMFLNPDASIEPASLLALVAFMDAHPDAGIAGCATYDTTASQFQPVGMLLTPMGLVRDALRRPGAYPQRQLLQHGQQSFTTNWVCGSSMMVRTASFERLQGFDPRFFLYYEETDLCLRATRAGLEIWAVGDAIAHHIGAASAKETGSQLTTNASGGSVVRFFYQSRFYYLAKSFGFVPAVAAETLTRCVEWLRWSAKKLLGREQPLHEHPSGRPFLQLPARIDEQTR